MEKSDIVVFNFANAKVAVGEQWFDRDIDLVYNPDEPYSVFLEIYENGHENEPVTWEFSRSLLEGKSHSSGSCDVVVMRDELKTLIRLSSPFGSCLIKLTRIGIMNFLDETYKKVPVGSEFHHINLDEEIEKLLT